MTSTVPLGFRFYPTEEELIGFYLQNKLNNRREDMERVIPVADVYCCDPWQLPPISGEACGRDGEQWFFFCPRQEREANGGRPTRTTPSGYWKGTGSPSLVYSSGNRAMGVKRTMVFYQGSPPACTKTKWKMNEYRALEEGTTGVISSVAAKLRGEVSLCRVYTRSESVRSFDRRPAAAAAAAATAAATAAAVVTDERRTAEVPRSSPVPASAKWSSSHHSSSSDGNASRRPVRRREDDLTSMGVEEWDSWQHLLRR